jgi:hypothetical protein
LTAPARSAGRLTEVHMRKLIAALAIVAALASLQLAVTASLAHAAWIEGGHFDPAGDCVGYCWSTPSHTYCVYVCRSAA